MCMSVSNTLYICLWEMPDAQMDLQHLGKSIRFSHFLQRILIFATLPFTLKESEALTCPQFLYLIYMLHVNKINLTLVLLFCL